MAHSFFQVLGDFGEGGDGRLAVGIAQALRLKGLSVTCVAVKVGGTDCLRELDVSAYELGANAGPAAFLRGLIRFRRLCAHVRPLVVHVHGPMSLLFVSLALLGRRRPPRLWFTWHDSGSVLEERGPRRTAIIWCLSRCERVFGSSRSVSQRLRRALPMRRDIHVFRNCVAEWPETTSLLVEKPCVVWCARFVPPKDPELLVRAAATLQREGIGFRLLMLGDAPPHLRWLHDRVKGLAEELGLGAHVEFPGWVNDPRPYYARAAVGVQTSRTEGLSMVLLEQMMSGLAIVATDVGDTSAAIQDGVSGFLVEPGDEAGLTNALRSMIQDPQLRSRLGRRARAKALSSFSFDAMTKRILRWRDTPAQAARGRPASS